MPAMAVQPGEHALFKRGRNRAFVKVQDGCRYRCSFCVVTLARGEERSREIHEVVEEINGLVDQGIKEIILTGVHLGGYGSENGTDLVQLISTILTHTDVSRLRLGSLEPWDLPTKFFDLFQNQRLMPHLHLPLQSGSNSVLRRMSRRCKTGEYEILINTARAVIPDFNLTTDVIVGFPGETEKEWKEGLGFIEKIGFSHIHIFSFSPRQGTKAAILPRQLPGLVKKRRSRELHKLAKRMKKSRLKQYLGRTFNILCEGSSEQDSGHFKSYSGYTPNYIRVMLKNSVKKRLNNQIKEARLLSLTVDGEGVIAELV
jgi:threonylcarbamoyladenosine tRNA methylthiotransferase MtaB